MKKIFIAVSVGDRLPIYSWRGFVFTQRWGKVSYNKLATYLGDDGWLITDGWDNEVVIHWLEEKEITDELFDKILNHLLCTQI